MSAAKEHWKMSSSYASTILSAMVSVNIWRKTHKQILIDMKFKLGPSYFLNNALEPPQTAKKVSEIQASRSTETLAISTMQRVSFVGTSFRQRWGAQGADWNTHRYFKSLRRILQTTIISSIFRRFRSSSSDVPNNAYFCIRYYDLSHEVPKCPLPAHDTLAQLMNIRSLNMQTEGQ